VLENFFPTATGVRMRRGSDPYAQVGNGDQDVVSMFAYVNGNNDKLFAATASSIYDITSPTIASHEVLIDDLGEYLVDENGIELATQYSIDTAIVSALAGGDWSVEQFATSGGVFLRGVNGIDTPLVYDGATWGTSPAITGSGLTANNLSYVWVHQAAVFRGEEHAQRLVPAGGRHRRRGGADPARRCFYPRRLAAVRLVLVARDRQRLE
jgi:hypothetical protein